MTMREYVMERWDRGSTRWRDGRESKAKHLCTMARGTRDTTMGRTEEPAQPPVVMVMSVSMGVCADGCSMCVGTKDHLDVYGLGC